MGYQKALKKLESLPVGERQLAAGQYVWEVKKGKSHCGCAIGKLLSERQRVKLFKTDNNKGGTEAILEFLGRPEDNGYPSDAPFGVADLTHYEATRLQSVNDNFEFGSGVKRNEYAIRKARYRHVIAWLQEQVAQAKDDADFRSSEFAP